MFYILRKTILACPMPIKTVLLRKIDVKSAGSQLADAIHSGKSVDTINLAMNPALAANPSDLLRTLGVIIANLLFYLILIENASFFVLLL